MLERLSALPVREQALLSLACCFLMAVLADGLVVRPAIRRIQAMDVEIIIPGRGAPCTKAAIPPLIEYIQEMRRRVSDFYGQGSSRRDTVDKVRNEMLERFPVADGRKDVIARQIRSSVERVYEEIRKGL